MYRFDYLCNAITREGISSLALLVSRSCLSAQTVLIYSMNRIDFKLPYEAPIAESFTLSAAPMNICVQFSGDADFEDFEEGEAL